MVFSSGQDADDRISVRAHRGDPDGPSSGDPGKAAVSLDKTFSLSDLGGFAVLSFLSLTVLASNFADDLLLLDMVSSFVPRKEQLTLPRVDR